MSESVRLKESGRPAFELLYSLFHGPRGNTTQTFSRSIQTSLRDLIQYVKLNETKSPKEIRANNDVIQTLSDLFGINQLLPAGQMQNIADIEDVNIISSQRAKDVEWFLTALNQSYRYVVSLVPYPVSSSSGNETT